MVTPRFQPWPGWLWLVLSLVFSLACLVHTPLAWGQSSGAQITQLTAKTSTNPEEAGVYLDARLQIGLPMAVESALLKGVPVQFVFEATVLRERWYWADHMVSTAKRTLRLAYQPLTRRWRLQSFAGTPGLFSGSNGLGLSWYFDSLPQAIEALARLDGWQIAAGNALGLGKNIQVELRFKLDMSPWPSPFQIGNALGNDWEISASRKIPLQGAP